MVWIDVPKNGTVSSFMQSFEVPFCRCCYFFCWICSNCGSLKQHEISCGVQSRKNRKKQTQITKSQKSWRKHEHKFVYSTGFSVLTNTYSCIEQEAMRKRDSQFFYESPLADSFLSGGALRMNYQNFICFAFSSNW